MQTAPNGREEIRTQPDRRRLEPICAWLAMMLSLRHWERVCTVVKTDCGPGLGRPKATATSRVQESLDSPGLSTALPVTRRLPTG